MDGRVIRFLVYIYIYIYRERERERERWQLYERLNEMSEAR